MDWRGFIYKPYKFLVNRFFENLSGAELRLYGSLNLDALSCLRVAAHAGGALGDAESAKAGYGDIFAATHRFHDGVKNCLNEAVSGGFCFKVSRFHYCLY